MGFFDIPMLGKPTIESPLKLSTRSGDAVCNYVLDEHKIPFSFYSDPDNIEDEIDPQLTDEKMEVAGPREKIFFDPNNTTCGIVTCGGLCPGLNNVIRSIVTELQYHYKVPKIYGFKFGFSGLEPKSGFEPVILNHDMVKHIHEQGGTFLGSSRGPVDTRIMADRLEALGISILFVIGGDGTQRGNYDLFQELSRRNSKIAVVGIPKTIDNDVPLVEKTFGFETAFSIAAQAIRCAHTEAISAWNGVGLVKLMGRHAGFIAGYAALGISNVNFVLVPEVNFDLKGPAGFLDLLRTRLETRHHAVVVVAEGAGGEYVEDIGMDASGNKKHGDIGLFLKGRIAQYLKEKNVPVTIKYIDPSYMIRSTRALPSDAVFSNQLGQYAVHAGMAGKTGMIVGWRKNTFVHLPLKEIVSRKKRINPESQFWYSVLEATGQPMHMTNSPRQF